MREAIELALRGRGEVEPNPRVGALAIADGAIVGRGWHRHWGGRHAEVEALADAAANRARPDTLVVTLEPCSTPAGVDGKVNPPCVDAIRNSPVRTVIAGAKDPAPRHRGRGFAALAEAGIRVQTGVLADECTAINGPFHRWLGLDRPWTIAKWAMSLDGKTAAHTGDARWISGESARQRSHLLRARVDAVAVGYRTVAADDPALTVRHVEGAQPIRLVIDPEAALPARGRMLETAAAGPIWLLVGEAHAERAAEAWGVAGAEVLAVPAAGPHRLDLAAAWRALRGRGLRRLLVEGGGGLCAELLAGDLIDQTLCFVAPRLIGGAAAPTPVGGAGQPTVAQAWRLAEMTWQACGEDLAIVAFRA